MTLERSLLHAYSSMAIGFGKEFLALAIDIDNIVGL